MAIKEHKLKKIEEFRAWLIASDAEFREHENGHFQVFKEGIKLMDVWATTEKCYTTTGSHIIGLNAIETAINFLRGV